LIVRFRGQLLYLKLNPQDYPLNAQLKGFAPGQSGCLLLKIVFSARFALNILKEGFNAMKVEFILK